MTCLQKYICHFIQPFFRSLQSVVSFFKFFGISDKFIFYGLFSTLGKIRFLAECISYYVFVQRIKIAWNENHEKSNKIPLGAYTQIRIQFLTVEKS